MLKFIRLYFKSQRRSLLIAYSLSIKINSKLKNKLIILCVLISGYREIVEQLLISGAKVGLLNKDGKVPANLADSSFLCEMIRNPNLIKDKLKYQNSILRNILEVKRRSVEQSLNVEACADKLLEFEDFGSPVKPDIYGGLSDASSKPKKRCPNSLFPFII